RMLDESDYTSAIGRELLLVTADLGIYSAWFAYDANNQALARQLYGEAALLADSALVTVRSACVCTPRWRGSARTWRSLRAGRVSPGKRCDSPSVLRARPVMNPPRRYTP
ncbi:MAG: hypothetical protein ACRD0H_07340, partial [Actinomycetes bacterium]